MYLISLCFSCAAASKVSSFSNLSLDDAPKQSKPSTNLSAWESDETLTLTQSVAQSKQPAKKGLATAASKVSSDFFSDFDIDDEEEQRQQEAAAAEAMRAQASQVRREPEPKSSGRLGYSEDAGSSRQSAQQARGAPARREEPPAKPAPCVSLS